MPNKSIKGTKVDLSKLLQLKRNISKMSKSFSLDTRKVLAVCDDLIVEKATTIKRLEERQSGLHSPNFAQLSVTHELADLLIAARLRAGWTQEKLALRVGLKRQQITRYESEKYARIKFSKLEEIARVLEQELQKTRAVS